MDLLRLPKVKVKMGYSSDTSVYNDQLDGLLPHSVKISERSVAWPSDEIEAVVAARVAGMTDDEIRTLVVLLHLMRTEIMLAPIAAAASPMHAAAPSVPNVGSLAPAKKGS